MQILGLNSLIRMNQLVRGSIDAAGFEAWWQSADEAERQSLARTLVFCARQAGIRDTMIPKALQMSGFSGNEDGVTQAVEAASSMAGAHSFYDWTPVAAGDSLHRAFRFAFFIFGLAEGEVFRGETPQRCNHWWHRDLTDPRVVADLLNDPQYDFTSMATDQRLKRRSWRQRLLTRR